MKTIVSFLIVIFGFIQYLQASEVMLNKEDDYLDQESEQLRTLKLLSLDVERKGLELKRQQLVHKMIKLNSLKDMSVYQPPEHKDVIVVLSVIVGNHQPMAVISVDNKHQTITPKQKISNGLVVENITVDGVLFKQQNDQKMFIPYSKG